MRVLENLKPEKVFYYFEEISNIPRGSGNEKAISDYIVNFAKERGLFVYQDDAWNVLIRKKGTKGYENSETVILQGHIDMVCEKNNDVVHDFSSEGLKLCVDGDFVSAKGTTLGGDDGIAVAYMLAVLDDDTVSHPPVECLFTTDEEVGMKGAIAFDASILEGRKLINLDTEEEGHILVSCCGGMKVTTKIPAVYENVSSDLIPCYIKIRGLKGGHSGADIHLQRANANKLMGRVLESVKDFDVKVSKVNGGLMDNAISRECDAFVFVDESKMGEISNVLSNIEKTFVHEYKGVDEDIKVNIEKVNGEFEYVAFDDITVSKIIDMLTLIPYGVSTMSMGIKGLVESSNNIGILRTVNNNIEFVCAVRSSIASRKDIILNQIETAGRLLGGETIVTSAYPAWEFNPDSELLKITKKVYTDFYKKEPIVEAIHAGLECGLFAEKVNGIDMISIGPDIFDVHTPDERLKISSTESTWEFLKAILASLK